MITCIQLDLTAFLLIPAKLRLHCRIKGVAVILDKSYAASRFRDVFANPDLSKSGLSPLCELSVVTAINRETLKWRAREGMFGESSLIK